MTSALARIENAIRQLEKILQEDSVDAIRHLRGVVEELQGKPDFNPKRVLREIEVLQDRSVLTVQDIDALALKITREVSK